MDPSVSLVCISGAELRHEYLRTEYATSDPQRPVVCYRAHVSDRDMQFSRKLEVLWYVGESVRIADQARQDNGHAISVDYASLWQLRGLIVAAATAGL